MEHPVIPGVPRHPQTQKPRADGFGLGGIGAGMVVPVPLEDLPAVFEIQPQNPAGQQHGKTAETGRDIVEHIVQPGRDTADILIGHLHITQHGIHGVDSLIGKGQGRAAQGKEKHGGDDAVGAVLRHGFHRSPCHRFFIQRRCIPSHDHGHGIPGLLNGSGFQGGIDLHALGFQAFGRQNLPAHNAADDKPQPGADQAAEPENGQRHTEADRHRKHPQNAPGGHLPGPGFRENSPQQLFQPGDQLADGHHRVGNGMRVPQQAIQKEAEEQR